jgi:protein-S-isoprenylcysteine O-methyltransferase Ste14
MHASSGSSRGTGWVVGQTILIVLIVASWFFGPGVTLLGLVPAVAGFALAGWAFRAMKGSMTPFPRPKRSGRFVEDGPYRFIRHPMYVGGILLLAGLSLVFSAWGLALTAALALFWVGKARVEERHLRERFPEYADYRRRTPF